MLEINFSKMSVSQLSELIAKAATELAGRCQSRPATVWQNTPPQPQIAAAPSSQEQNFIRVVLTTVKNGGVVKAIEKDDYAAIAKAYPDWFAHKHYPTGLRGAKEAQFKKFGIIR